MIRVAIFAASAKIESRLRVLPTATHCIAKGTWVLQTSRLFLREVSLTDCAALFEIESNPVVTRFLPFDPRTEIQTRAYIETALCDQRSDPRLTHDMAITL